MSYEDLFFTQRLEQLKADRAQLPPRGHPDNNDWEYINTRPTGNRKANNMFGFFYPENNQRFLASLSFSSADEAVAYFRDKRSTWQEIKAAGDDNAAFLDPLVGRIVVVRELTP